MKRQEALNIAQDIMERLKPHVERIQVAGSIRRKKPDVKDIEIVCIPKRQELKDMFGEVTGSQPISEFDKAMRGLGEILKGNPSGKMMQIALPQGINLDFFMCHKHNWGLILLIRTGGWHYSKAFMGTWIPQAGYKCQDGEIWKREQIIPLPEERDVFELANIDYLSPEKR